MAPIKKPYDPEKRCKDCQGRKKQCGRCAGTADSQAARKRRQEKEKSSRVPDPLLERNRKRNREADRAVYAAAKANNCVPDRKVCKGVDGPTGKPCTRPITSHLSIDGSPRCRRCYKAAVGDRAYKELLRKRHDALPQCGGTNKKGMACKYRIDGQGGILNALRRTGATTAGVREAVETEASIKRLVAAYTKSGLCLWCFKRRYTGLGKELNSLTRCNADDDSCQRVAHRNGLCGHHYGLTLPASSTQCAGEAGDFTCESGKPRMGPSKGNLCKPCFDAMTTRMAAEPTARPAKRQRREEE